jgi:hypothetical protein
LGGRMVCFVLCRTAGARRSFTLVAPVPFLLRSGCAPRSCLLTWELWADVLLFFPSLCMHTSRGVGGSRWGTECPPVRIACACSFACPLPRPWTLPPVLSLRSRLRLVLVSCPVPSARGCCCRGGVAPRGLPLARPCLEPAVALACNFPQRKKKEAVRREKALQLLEEGRAPLIRGVHRAHGHRVRAHGEIHTHKAATNVHGGRCLGQGPKQGVGANEDRHTP